MNTRSKRASSVGIGLIWLLAPVLPDATISQGDRQHIAISYSGILAGALNVTEVTAYARVIVRDRVRRVVVPPNSRSFRVPKNPRIIR